MIDKERNSIPFLWIFLYPLREPFCVGDKDNIVPPIHSNAPAVMVQLILSLIVLKGIPVDFSLKDNLFSSHIHNQVGPARPGVRLKVALASKSLNKTLDIRLKAVDECRLLDRFVIALFVLLTEVAEAPAPHIVLVARQQTGYVHPSGNDPLHVRLEAVGEKMNRLSVGKGVEGVVEVLLVRWHLEGDLIFLVPFIVFLACLGRIGILLAQLPGEAVDQPRLSCGDLGDLILALLAEFLTRLGGVHLQ